MNKLDKQFEGLMKGISIESPSKDFTSKVMGRIQAEAAVQKHSLLADYQPVISRKTWIILIAGFVLLVVYALISSPESSTANEPGFLSNLTKSLPKIDTQPVSSFWQTVSGMFASIPTMAYLVLTASLALWTLDLFLTRFRHTENNVQVG